MKNTFNKISFLNYIFFNSQDFNPKFHLQDIQFNFSRTNPLIIFIVIYIYIYHNDEEENISFIEATILW